MFKKVPWAKADGHLRVSVSTDLNRIKAVKMVLKRIKHRHPNNIERDVSPCHTFSRNVFEPRAASTAVIVVPILISPKRDWKGTLQDQANHLGRRLWRIPMVAADDWIFNMNKPAPMITPLTGRSPKVARGAKGFVTDFKGFYRISHKVRQRKSPTPKPRPSRLLGFLLLVKKRSAAPGKSWKGIVASLKPIMVKLRLCRSLL